LRLRYGEDGARIEPRLEASAARRALEAYFDGKMGALDALPVRLCGTPFQQQVWTALRDIPVGRRNAAPTSHRGSGAKRPCAPSAWPITAIPSRSSSPVIASSGGMAL
jgi:hypothetical protein